MWQDIKTAPEKEKWYFYNGDPIYGAHKITHWMPFPEPPFNDTP